jgi:hypothetical protein
MPMRPKEWRKPKSDEPPKLVYRLLDTATWQPPMGIKGRPSQNQRARGR